MNIGTRFDIDAGKEVVKVLHGLNAEHGLLEFVLNQGRGLSELCIIRVGDFGERESNWSRHGSQELHVKHEQAIHDRSRFEACAESRLWIHTVMEMRVSLD